MKTIPFYWGCSNIDKFFDIEGIIKFENADDLITKANNLSKIYYSRHIEKIEKNYILALKYVNYEQNIIDAITDLFKLNGMIK